VYLLQNSCGSLKTSSWVTVQEIHATGIASRKRYAVCNPSDIFCTVFIFNSVAKSRPTLNNQNMSHWHSIYFNRGKMLCMDKRKKEPSKSPSQKHIEKEVKKIEEAHHQADQDIEHDPDLTTRPNPEDDLDEGELARLEGED